MATPRFDALVAKVRDWSNKPEVNTIPDSVIQSCLSYAADESYRLLRIPPLEETVIYTITSQDNVGENSMGLPYGNAYTSFPIPASPAVIFATSFKSTPFEIFTSLI